MNTFQTISPDTLGLISLILMDTVQREKSKRKRKAAFNDFVRLVRLTRLIPGSANITNIGQGVDSNGFSVFIITYTVQEPV
jgi:hypothetical protein